MRQADYNRAEEYITLRDELRELLAHGRFILYVTSVFVVGALAWYLGKSEIPYVGPAAFALFLYAVLGLSSLIYINSFSQAFRIGGYLTVFWESYDEERRLKWHRFNRRGATGGYLTGAAQIAYTLLASIVVGFLLYMLAISPSRLYGWIWFSITMGIGEAWAFAMLRSYLHSEQVRFEHEWYAIQTSPDQQDLIHGEYETLPSRIVLP